MVDGEDSGEKGGIKDLEDLEINFRAEKYEFYSLTCSLTLQYFGWDV